MALSYTPTEVLMVGSIPYDTLEEVFTRVCSALPGRIHAIPDGEIGDRQLFVVWQGACFPPEAVRTEWGGGPYSETSKSNLSIDSIKPTNYDTVAISSYQVFNELRKKGAIPADMRFQVCIPTPINVVMPIVKEELQVEVEPLYEQRLQQSIDHLVKSIPRHDLIIQFDMPLELASIEYERGRVKESYYKPFFAPAKAGGLERALRVIQRIPTDVHVAFHLCYGDLGHRHWVEPEDTSLLVEMANALLDTVGKSHQVEWIHLPVPRNRVDAPYFEPLNQLRLNSTRLFLGLVHAGDEAGTIERINIAHKTYPHDFGVATECGLGRTPRDEIDSILSISKAVTTPQHNHATNGTITPAPNGTHA